MITMAHEQEWDKVINTLNEKGWCRGTFQDENGKVCALGAISLVATENGWAQSLVSDLLREASNVLLLMTAGKIASISLYNDEHARDKQDVIALMEKARAHE